MGGRGRLLPGRGKRGHGFRVAHLEFEVPVQSPGDRTGERSEL